MPVCVWEDHNRPRGNTKQQGNRTHTQWPFTTTGRQKQAAKPVAVARRRKKAKEVNQYGARQTEWMKEKESSRQRRRTCIIVVKTKNSTDTIFTSLGEGTRDSDWKGKISRSFREGRTERRGTFWTEGKQGSANEQRSEEELTGPN